MALALFCVGYLTPVITLNIPFVQRKVVLFSETELSKLFKTTVKIGEINISWLNRITLRDVVIEDLKGDTLLRADNITAGFKLLPALRNRWILTTVRLFGVTCRINKESSQNEINIQFLLDAFSGNPQGDSNLEMHIESILIRRGTIMYDVLDKDSTPQSFNPNHISIDNLSGKLSVRHYSKDSLQAQINRLSFIETSGLNVNRLSARITGNQDSLSIENLSLTLPHSSILIPSAALCSAQKDSLQQLTGQSSLTIRLAPSTIAPQDFAFLTPVLKDFTDAVNVTADVSGYTNSLSLEKLTLTYGNDLFFSGSMDLRNAATKAEELYLFGQVKSLHVTTKGLQRITTNFNPQNMPLPEPVMNLGELNFTGEISGFTDHLVAFGNLSSPVGSIQMDMLISQQRNKDTTLYLKGSLASSDLQINALFEEGNPYGIARFYVDLDMVQPRDKSFSGTVNAQIKEVEYRTHNYENIYIAGQFKENEYEGIVQVNDPNGQLEMQGLFRNRDEKSVFDFMARLKHFHPDKLHLTDRFENPDISLSLNANFTGNNPDDFNGYIELKNLAFLTEKDSFSIQDFRIETEANEQALNQINISSSILNGSISGNYSFSSLIPNLLSTVETYLPSLIHSVYAKMNVPPLSEGVRGKPFPTNLFDFNFTVENTENLSKTLKLPVANLQKADIYGHYNSITHSLSTVVDAPLIKTGNIKLEKVNLHLDNTDEALYLNINAVQIGKNESQNYIHFTSSFNDDRIFSFMKWTNDSDEKFEAELATSTLFIDEPDRMGAPKLRTEITIPPSQIILKDTIWNIEPASVTITEGKVMIDNFYVTKGNQHLLINGILSDYPKDTLFLDLKDLEISFIFDILNKPQIQFGGQATGKIQARDLFGSMMIEGRLEVEDFSFHNAVQGKLNIQSEWDNERQGILLVGSIYKTDSIYTDVEGHIFPIGPEQGLSLTFNANEINVAFLQKYMNAFADSISGLGFGEVRLYGSFSDIYLEGTPYVKDAKMKLNVLNASYTFSDTIYLEKSQILSRNTTVYDREGHSGYLDFTLKHNCFRDMAYILDIRADNVLVYDFSERISPEIYGKVYASGTATITGTEETILVEGNVRSDPGTAVGFNFANSSIVDNLDFITFKQLAEISETNDHVGNEKQDNEPSSMEYMLNFLVNVTPDAQFELIMNPATGDKITGSGSGNFQVSYGSQNDMQIFGNYFISNGLYNFNLEQVIRKRFNIREGSVVTFRGDPMIAELNINAIYNLAANIQDLDEMLIKNTASPTVSVNCVLYLEGHLQNPAITFDLELPNSNPELERQVKSFIDTEDMMTRQIIYLLLLQKFYTPDYSRNDFRGNEFSVVASQALSAQLSNILNSFTDKVQIGTLIRSRQDGIKDTEIDMLLSSQLLNNRLLFNGNFGYKDNYIQSNAFVGEFDLEYKLSRSGDISLKAYNHANDLYRYTKSLTRQGVGVMFHKDFAMLSDLFRRRKKTLDVSIQ